MTLGAWVTEGARADPRSSAARRTGGRAVAAVPAAFEMILDALTLALGGHSPHLTGLPGAISLHGLHCGTVISLHGLHCGTALGGAHTTDDRLELGLLFT